jgi:hypothetical protein
MWGFQAIGKNTRCSESCGNGAKNDSYNPVIDLDVFFAQVSLLYIGLLTRSAIKTCHSISVFI